MHPRKNNNNKTNQNIRYSDHIIVKAVNPFMIIFEYNAPAAATVGT